MLDGRREGQAAEGEGQDGRRRGKVLHLRRASHPGAAATNAGAEQAGSTWSRTSSASRSTRRSRAAPPTKAGCGCQAKIIDDVSKLADTKIAEFVKCKKTVLKNGANSGAVLQACVDDAGTAGSIKADSKGKIAKALVKAGRRHREEVRHAGRDDDVLPGSVHRHERRRARAVPRPSLVECRVCQAINDMDALFVNCDVFDDAVANGTCFGHRPDADSAPTRHPARRRRPRSRRARS